jgi:hypothetical protein
MVMSAFRRSVKADTKRTGGKGGKWVGFERLRLPIDVPTPFLPINAVYVDPNPSPEEMEIDAATGRAKEVTKFYFKVRKHKRQVMINGKERYPESVCSAGWNPHSPQPCAGCAAIDQGDKSVGVSDVVVIGVAHLAVYHRHPKIDSKTGGIVMKQNQQQGKQPEPVTYDEECTGRACNYCRIVAGQPLVQDPQKAPFPQYRPQDIQTFFGKRRYLELGKNHLMNLGGWDSTISSLCGNDGSQLITDGFKCPTCQTLLVDMSQETRTDAQIQEVVAKPFPCMRCQRPVLLEEVVACEICEQNGRQPRQFGLTDRVLWGMRQGENTSSQLVLHRHESVQEFFTRVPAHLLGGKTPDQLLADLTKPYDFAAMFAPKPIGEQMRELELTGQPGPVPNQVMPGYGQPQGYQQAPQGYPQQPPQYQQPPPQYPPQQAPQYQQPPPQYQQPAPQYQQPAPNYPPGYGAPPPIPGYQPPTAPAQPGPQAPQPMMHPNYGTGGNS